MTSQPDKLFRDTLENFQRPAPVGAWDKIEQKLAKPNPKIVWLRIAAGIALLTTAAILVWPSENTEQGITKIEEKNQVKKNDAVQTTVLKKETEIKDETKQSTRTYTAQTKAVTTSIDIKKKEQKSVLPVNDTPSLIDSPETNELVAERVMPEEKEPVSRTLVYTADEVNSKFLKKKLPPEATPESKEASGIQKLIGLAYAAKNSEAGLGELRQKKDDLLAFSFGKKKGEN
jgi:hypothetical protein